MTSRELRRLRAAASTSARLSSLTLTLVRAVQERRGLRGVDETIWELALEELARLGGRVEILDAGVRVRWPGDA